MNDTPRWLARGFLLLVGLASTLLGAVAISAHAHSQWRQQWGEVVRPLTGLPGPWVYALCGGALVLVVAIALIVVAAQRRTRYHTVLVENTPGRENSQVAVDVALVGQLLEDAAGQHPAITNLGARCFRTGGTPMVQVTARMRRGTDPIAVAGHLHDDLDDVDVTLGTHIPRVVELTREKPTIRRARRALR